MTTWLRPAAIIFALVVGLLGAGTSVADEQGRFFFVAPVKGLGCVPLAPVNIGTTSSRFCGFEGQEMTYLGDVDGIDEIMLPQEFVQSCDERAGELVNAGGTLVCRLSGAFCPGGMTRRKQPLT